MAGLRTEIELVDGVIRRHDLALAGKRLGEEGLSDRKVLPGNFPPGTFKRPVTSRRSSLDPGQRVSWMAGLLPYMGRQGLYGQIRFDQSWKDPGNWFATRALVPEFLDPTFPRDSRYVAPPGLPLEAAGTHYVGLSGIGPESVEWAAGDPAALAKLGIFGYDRGISLKEIKDSRGGLANTILMIRTPHDGPAGVTPWMAGGGSTIRSVPEKNSLEPFLSRESDGKRGTYVIMTDGSVRYIKEGMSDQAFQALATVRAPMPEGFDIEKEAPKQAAPKKGAPPPVVKKEPPIKLPPIKEQPKDPTTPKAEIPAGWQELSPPGGGFTVFLPPGKIDQKSEETPLPGGGKATTQIFMLDLGDKGGYVVGFGRVPPDKVAAGSESRVLEATIQGTVKNLRGAKINEQKDISLQGHPGRTVTVEIPGKAVLQIRVYVARGVIYQMLVGGPGKMAFSADADRFLQSLKIEAGAPEQPPVKIQPVPKGGGEQAGWKEYSPAGAGCTVLMPPGQIIPLTQDVPTPQGKSRLYVHTIQKDVMTKYALLYGDLPGGAKPGLEEAILNGARDGIPGKVPGARITNEEKITLGTYPGRALTVDMPKVGLIRARVYLVGNRLYQLMVLGNNAFITSPDAERFLGSLKLNDK
ncbi:MAG: DUF1559 domain-containing protein [Gemmataceae bacterium]|nr:DUF1559 domain-containing protein [Gemmataceae bacterium]